MSFLLNPIPPFQGTDPLHKAWFSSEKAIIDALVEQLNWEGKRLDDVAAYAKDLSLYVRDIHSKKGGMDSFMTAYDLSSDEGIALMCMAEALLRIPDAYTQNALIIDKICKGRWDDYLG